MTRTIRLSLLLSWIIFLAIVPSACVDDANLVGEQMPYRYQFDFPAGLNTLNTHFFVRNSLPTNYRNLIGSRNINSIRPFQARLTSSENIDWAFVREVEVQIRDPNDPGVKIPVFYRDQIPQNIGNGIDLIPSLADATDLMSLDEIDVTIEIRLWATSSATFTADIFLTFAAQ